MFKLSNLEIINKYHIGEGQICSKLQGALEKEQKLKAEL
jgi:hypothetical protein